MNIINQILKIFIFNIIFLANGFTVMIDPFGDSKNIGRNLDHNFERIITMQFAQELKNKMAEQASLVHIVLTKKLGEILDEIQIANFANRLEIDLFLSISFYKETNTKPSVFIYQFKNQTFFSKYNKQILAFYPYHQAFIMNFDASQSFANQICKSLQNPKYQYYFDCKAPIAFPFKPLSGIIAPAIAIELGLKNDNYDIYIAPIISFLEEIACQ